MQETAALAPSRAHAPRANGRGPVNRHEQQNMTWPLHSKMEPGPVETRRADAHRKRAALRSCDALSCDRKGCFRVSAQSKASSLQSSHARKFLASREKRSLWHGHRHCESRDWEALRAASWISRSKKKRQQLPSFGIFPGILWKLGKRGGRLSKQAQSCFTIRRANLAAQIQLSGDSPK